VQRSHIDIHPHLTQSKLATKVTVPVAENGDLRAILGTVLLRLPPSQSATTSACVGGATLSIEFTGSFKIRAIIRLVGN
jgi:hypothetical protein